MRNNDNCLPFVEHLHCEHRRLNGVVQQILHAIQAWKENRESAAHVQQQLELLRNELRHHFAEEEGEGCLEEAVAHRPSIAGEMRTVQHEHGVLNSELDRIIAQVSAAVPTATEAEKLEQEFLAFTKRLRIHEAAENRILQAGFGSQASELDDDCQCDDAASRN